MGVRGGPRPLQDTPADFLPHFEVRPPKRAAASLETASLGPLFAGAAERRLQGADGAVQCDRPETRSIAGAAPVMEGDLPGGRAVGTAPAQPARPGRRVGSRLWRGFSWKRAFGFRIKPRPVRSASQGELSLATIQVKRNDLLDADLELIWNRSGTVPATPAAGQPGRASQGGSPASGGPAGSSRAGGRSFWRRWLERRSGPER